MHRRENNLIMETEIGERWSQVKYHLVLLEFGEKQGMDSPPPRAISDCGSFDIFILDSGIKTE